MYGFIELISMTKDRILVRTSDITLVMDTGQYCQLRLHGSPSMIEVKHSYDEVKRMIELNSFEEDDLK